MSAMQRTDESGHACFGAFVLDRADERLWSPSGPVRLGRKAFLVLEALLRTPGRLVTKEELFSTVWDGTVVSESVLTTVMKELRRALGEDRQEARWIETVYGRGYRFVGEVRWSAVPPGRTPAPAAPSPSPSLSRPPVVIVATFEDVAVRGEYPWLASGLREEILFALARFRDIRLIAEPADVASSGTRMGEPGYQLVAALLPDTAGVKVIARVRRPDGEIVWADSIALSGGGLVQSVDTIVRRIIGAALPAVDKDVFLGLPVQADTFYARYVRARTSSFESRSYAETRAAAAELEHLIAEHPGFGLAYPPLVRLLNTDHAYTGLGTTGPAERARALALAKAGLAADPLHAHAHLVLGFCHLWHEERDLAFECLEEALRLNPFNPGRLLEVGTGFMWLGELGRARTLFEESLSLQPLSEDRYHEDRAELALLSGDFDDARMHLRRVRGQRLWSALYDALVSTDTGKLVAWRATVAEHWIGGDLDQQRLVDWISFHRAFEPGLKGRFMDLVYERLREIASHPISEARAETKQVIGGTG